MSGSQGLAFALALTALAASINTASAHDHAASRGRLVFGDHQKPVVGVIDLDTYKVTDTFDLPKPNPVFVTAEDGRHVVIKTGDDAGTVRILDTGVTFDDHGDHHDIDKGEVRLLDSVFTGVRPAHVVSEHGELAVFFDGDRPWEGKTTARTVILKLPDLEKEKPEIGLWEGPAPQHGIAIPLGGDQWLISIASEAYARGDNPKASSRPDGFHIVDRAKGWAEIASFNDTADPERSCKLFHGHAGLDGVHAFACNQRAEGDPQSDGGILLIGKGADGAWTSRKLAYPDGRRSSTIKAGQDGPYLVANYGLKSPYDALLRIDPKAEGLTEADVFAVPGGQAVCQYEVTGDGKRVVNLTADGRLRVYDLAPEWKEVTDFEAVPAFDCASGAATPVPALALVGNSAFVSDPVNGRIREFHLNTLQQGLDIPVGGMPTKLAAGNHPH